MRRVIKKTNKDSNTYYYVVFTLNNSPEFKCSTFRTSGEFSVSEFLKVFKNKYVDANLIRIINVLPISEEEYSNTNILR